MFVDVLVSTKRLCKHLTDLTDEETADLFVVAKKVQKMLERVGCFCELDLSGELQRNAAYSKEDGLTEIKCLFLLRKCYSQVCDTENE